MLAKEFENMIDGNIPFNNDLEFKNLLIEAMKIGSDTVFKILEEICRVPSSKKIDQERLRALLSIFDKEFDHPLKGYMVECAKKYISRENMPIPEVLELLNHIKDYPNYYNALNIVYFACDDSDGIVESKYNTIINEWQNIAKS